MLSMTLQWVLPKGMAVHDGHEWRSIIASGGNDQLPAELFNHHTHRLSPYRFHARGQSVAISTWTDAATKTLEGLTAKLHMIVDAWTRSVSHRSPKLEINLSPVNITPSARVYPYTIHGLIVVDRPLLEGKRVLTLPRDHPWSNLTNPMQCPDLVTHLEGVIRRGVIRQANALGLDVDEDLGVLITGIRAMCNSKAYYDGAPLACNLTARNVEFGMAADIEGSWSVGRLTSRGYGCIRKSR